MFLVVKNKSIHEVRRMSNLQLGEVSISSCTVLGTVYCTPPSPLPPHPRQIYGQDYPEQRFYYAGSNYRPAHSYLSEASYSSYLTYCSYSSYLAYCSCSSYLTYCIYISYLTYCSNSSYLTYCSYSSYMTYLNSKKNRMYDHLRNGWSFGWFEHLELWNIWSHEEVLKVSKVWTSWMYGHLRKWCRFGRWNNPENYNVWSNEKGVKVWTSWIVKCLVTWGRGKALEGLNILNSRMFGHMKKEWRFENLE